MPEQIPPNDTESHPLFPSGEWEGFYTYEFGPGAQRHWMSFVLRFQAGVVSGEGGDDVAAFQWAGGYDTLNLTCQMTKVYPTHLVDYQGNVDENGIWGTWRIYSAHGGFHIWPKKQKQGNEAENEQEMGKKEKESKKAIEIVRI
jgi:hypothetical protein